MALYKMELNPNTLVIIYIEVAQSRALMQFLVSNQAILDEVQPQVKLIRTTSFEFPGDLSNHCAR